MIVAIMIVQLAMVVIETFGEPSESFTDRYLNIGLVNLVLGMITAAVILPACRLFDRPPRSGAIVDAALWACVVTEGAIMVTLSRLSAGAWSNYAIEGIVLLSVLAARAMARACDEAPTGRLLLLGALAVLITAILQIGEEQSVRRADRIAVAEIYHQVQGARDPPSSS